MTIELSWPAAASACAVLTILGKVVHGLVGTALESRDEAINVLRKDLEKKKVDHDVDVVALKATQKTLFERIDSQARELQNHKLHVAETYVNQAALEKLLVPIERRLEMIEKDLREPRK